MTTPKDNGAVPREFEKDEITGVIKDPEALKAARAKRPTEERIERVEAKQDRLVDDISEIKADVAEIKGSMTIVPELVSLLRETLKDTSSREGAKLTATLAIGQAQATDQLKDAEVKREILKSAATKLLAGVALAATAVLAAIQARGC